MTIQEMVDKRNAAVNAARAIVDEYETADEPMPEDKRAQYDKAMADVHSWKDKIENRKALNAVEAEKFTDPDKDPTRPDKPAGDVEKRDEDEPFEIEYRGHSMRFETGSDPHRRSTPDYHAAYNGYLKRTEANDPFEVRALQADSDEAGGYTAPMQFVVRLIQAVDDRVFVRQLGTVLPLPTGTSLGAPSLDADPADPDWTSEILTGSADTAMDFGKRALSPYPLAQRIRVSKTLVRQSAIGIDALVRERLAYKQATIQETAFMTGSGANQPLGVFTASSHGISTGRDVSTDNTTTEIRTDNLVRCKYTLKEAYRNSGSLRWVFHKDAISLIARLKDGNGQYLWRESMAANEPDRILNIPVAESEYAPNTFTTGLYVGILGDFSNYWIADSLAMSIQVVTELYAATNQNGYFSRSETDGMPVLEEAFVRVTLA